MKHSWKILSALSLALALLLPATAALASTAAFTKINNLATLTFDGGTPISASVEVTVTHVPSTPNLVVIGGTKAYLGTDTPTITDSVIITSTSNGPALYDVDTSVTVQSNNTDSGRISTSSSDPAAGTTVTGVSIGASVTTGISTTTSLRIPAGQITGSGPTLAVNGLGNTGVVSVAGQTRTISAVPVDNGDGTYTLTLGGAPLSGAPTAGTPVYGQVTVLFYAYPGTVATTGTDITTTVQAVVSTPGASDASALSSPINTWTTPTADISMTKFVRNVTDAVIGSGATDFQINGVSSTYYTGDVTGKPGEVLEYVVFVTNDSAVSPLNGCAISDGIPTDYVVLINNVYGANKDLWLIDATTVAAGVGIALPAVPTSGTPGSYSAPDLVVNVGTGANYNTTGSIPALGTALIAYRVAINP